jgi:hypothetical protein
MVAHKSLTKICGQHVNASPNDGILVGKTLLYGFDTTRFSDALPV